jgi:hypothetical protein
MRTAPSKAAEILVAFLIPPACREEVVGDLHERYRSPLRYAGDALCTIPLVIFSRVRRTSDVRLVFTQVLAGLVSYLGAGWITDTALLQESWGLVRLAFPALMTVLGLVLYDAYANPRRPPWLGMAHAPLAGTVLAVGSQTVLWAGPSDFAVPGLTLAFGCAMSLLFSTGVRMLFPPVSSHPQGAGAPAFWLKLDSAPVEIPAAVVRWLKGIASILAILLFVLIAYRLWERGA